MNLLKTKLGSILFFVIFFIVPVSLGIILNSILEDTAQKNLPVVVNENTSTFTELPKPIIGLPLRLKIPQINGDFLVEGVGVTANGEMDVPKGPTTTAWFNLGPRPGEEGSAVISGHFGWKNGVAAAFDNLHNLKSGDKIYVESDMSTSTVFVVREVRLYDQHADDTNIFSSNDEKAHLNLITCEGIWNKDQKSYSNRLVVFTDKE